MNDTVELLHTDLTDEWFERLRSSDRIAWDIETNGLDWRDNHIATCQLHTPDTGTAIVQINGGVPDRLRELLADQSVLKVFHHAAFDLRFMCAHWKVAAESVACTKVASKLLWPSAEPHSHSLQALLVSQLGVEINKQQRLSDWFADDLTPEQLRYAAGDVQHLLPLLDRLVSRQRASGLNDLYQRCCWFLPSRVELDLAGYGDVYTY